MTQALFRLVPGLRAHDATITSLLLARRTAVEFQRLDGSSVRLVMSDCSGFGSTGLRSWPIASTVQVFELAEHAHEVSAVDWQTLVGGDFSPSQAEISKMSSSAPRLVTISCAFGGALAVLCDSVSVEEIAR